MTLRCYSYLDMNDFEGNILSYPELLIGSSYLFLEGYNPWSWIFEYENRWKEMINQWSNNPTASQSQDFYRP
jgi:hypothetical protein